MKEKKNQDHSSKNLFKMAILILIGNHPLQMVFDSLPKPGVRGTHFLYGFGATGRNLLL